MKGEKSAATMVIHGPGRMTARGRRDIVKWLRRNADRLEQEGKNYTHGTFRASFRYFPR